WFSAVKFGLTSSLGRMTAKPENRKDSGNTFGGSVTTSAHNQWNITCTHFGVQRRGLSLGWGLVRDFAVAVFVGLVFFHRLRRIENNRYLSEGSRGGCSSHKAGIVLNGFVRMRHCERICMPAAQETCPRNPSGTVHTCQSVGIAEINEPPTRAPCP